MNAPIGTADRVQVSDGPRTSEEREEPLAGSHAFGGMRLIVSPAAGRLRHLPPASFHDGDEWVSPGQTVAIVEQGPTQTEVRSPIEARVVGVLVRDGEPVLRGQPLVWLDDSQPRTPTVRAEGTS